MISTSPSATRPARQRTFKRTPGAKVVDNDPLSACRSAGSHHRQADSRRRGLPGDLEMKRFACVHRALDSAAAAGVRTEWGRPGAAVEAGHRLLADLQRRLLRTAVQHADEDQRRERQVAEPRVDLPPWPRRTGGGSIKATPLQVDGVLYFAAARSRVGGRRPHRARALALHAGSRRAAIHIGNRGVGVFGDWLYFETPDCNLVSLDIKDGHGELAQAVLRSRSVCTSARSRRSSIKNHVIVGVSGDDLDQSRLSRSARSRDRRAALAVVRRRRRRRAIPARTPGPTSTWPSTAAA